MVTNEHYRWDFIGLSTDTKPTPENSEKVVDGSTFYCSDTSKLYVYCRDNWYERKALGGGGGTSYTAGNGIDISDDTISVDTDVIQEKLTAGDNITIENGTISATGSSVNVVQTIGTSTTDVMSQDAATKMITLSPNQNSVNILSTSNYANYSVAIGKNAFTSQQKAIAIGGASQSTYAARAEGASSVAIGDGAYADRNFGVAIGASTRAGLNGVAIGNNAGYNKIGGYNIFIGDSAGEDTPRTNYESVGIGHKASPQRNGEVNIGSGNSTYGFNNTAYRVLGGVHDGQDAHDAVTVEQINATIDAINTALSTSIPHIGATS